MHPRSISSASSVRLRTFGCLFFLIWAAMASLYAQSTGSVVGTVTDSSGANFAGGPVTLTNIGTSERRASLTDNNGNYQFFSVVPGKYRVDIEKPGFKHFTQELTVQLDTASRVDVAMQVGEMTQLVEVTAQSALVQTDSATLGQVVEGRQVDEMPLSGRNVMVYQTIVQEEK
jgi:hypothetical protein